MTRNYINLGCRTSLISLRVKGQANQINTVQPSEDKRVLKEQLNCA